MATCCGLLGCFLILRKMAMVGDAISHAVLPGIVIAFLITGSRASVPMLFGAALFGVLTTILIEFLYQKARLQADASIGVTFTWLFAIGVVLISWFAGKVDLDQECVLYGEIANVPLNQFYLESGMAIGPKAVWILGISLLLILLFIWRGYRGLFITTFNPEFAASVGISTVFWHYALMSAVSLTAVVSFDVVGAILVVAFLIVPPATAYLMTHSLPKMLLLTVLIGILTSVLGYILASIINGSVAGAMTTISGLLFVLAMLFAPGSGLLVKRKQKKRPSEMPVATV